MEQKCFTKHWSESEICISRLPLPVSGSFLYTKMPQPIFMNLCLCGFRWPKIAMFAIIELNKIIPERKVLRSNGSSMWHVYILECADKTLYTGISSDLERRIREHNQTNLGAKYTRSRRPVVLAYARKFKTRPQALKEELRIKKLGRTGKLEMIKSNRAA